MEKPFGSLDLCILIVCEKNAYTIFSTSFQQVTLKIRFGLHLFPLQSSFPVGQSLGPGPGISYSPYLSPVTHGMGLVATEMLPSSPMIVPGSPAVAVQSSNSSSSSQKTLRSDKLEVKKPFTQLQLTGFTLSVACGQYSMVHEKHTSTHTKAHIYPGFRPYIASDLRVAIFVVG